MEKLIKSVENALNYHVKDTATKYDILIGDEQLLTLIIDNYRNQHNYQQLRIEVIKLIEKHLHCDSQIQENKYELTSDDSQKQQIDSAIYDILKNIENEFVRNELIRISFGTKKMLRGTMFLNIQNEKNYQYAALIELFHLATLVQDDVIDNATLRRFKQTTNSRFDERTAILVADYLLVHIGYTMHQLANERKQEISQKQDEELAEYLEDITKDFLYSLLKSERQASTIKSLTDYDSYAINKTAKFFGIVIVCGLLTNTPTPKIPDLKNAYQFGIEFGLMFQKIDDLLDYQADVKISGKDASDSANQINNFVILSVVKNDIEQIKIQLLNDIEKLEQNSFASAFDNQIKYLKWRING